MAKVLLVEDDNNLREIYEARLQAEGYEIVSANDGEQALVVAKDEKPDLVISDVMMPKISGFEMLDILRNTEGLQDVKVIMLTALGQAEDKTRADQLGANRYLVKSQVTLEDIVKTAHQLLDDEPAADAAPAATAADASVSGVPANPPAAEPTSLSDDTAATPTVPSDDAAADAPSTQSEQADMAAQISSFEQQADTAAPPAVEPSTDEPSLVVSDTPAVSEAAAAEAVDLSVAPAPEPSVAADDAAATDTATNDQTMADAVESLADNNGQKPSEIAAVEVPPEVTGNQDPATNTMTSTPVPEPAAPATADDTDDNPGSDGVTIAHKKVIQPINDVSTAKPDINELLAVEEAKAAAAQADTAAPPAAATPPAPAADESVTPPVAPDAGTASKPEDVDPNSVAL